ncbi:ATG16-domain-containing protein [Pisolithus orientalis]|uniref:ATG16-domain-containing protein n=1 Tax=Pisolithus orientalis TaxID=936130 RepID=UPI002225924B|nr:ATG16-domain-containing protein [Pisolithus orientalis]KAI6005185.1 ATG16-domain-containing protein [Pisolithus orientalis]
MAEPSWQEAIRIRLVERNAKQTAFASIIEQYRRLAQQTKLLKERNASLLKAVGSVRPNPSSSTVYIPGTAGSGEDNPVRVAYIASLESQISSLRDELASVYKTQGQNAQRLLAMNETLREKEELSRIDSENLRKARDDIAHLRRKVDQHNEIMAEKDRTAQVLHDEINTLQLELGQIEERNQILVKDNAKLLQRWLDDKQAQANKLNEANDLYEDLRSRHQAVINWQGQPQPQNTPAGTASRITMASQSGNGVREGEGKKETTTAGQRSQPETQQDQSPNG